jgi:hypothetical protein
MCVARAMPKSRVSARYRHAIERAAVSPTTTISERTDPGNENGGKEGPACVLDRGTATNLAG